MVLCVYIHSPKEDNGECSVHIAVKPLSIIPKRARIAVCPSVKAISTARPIRPRSRGCAPVRSLRRPKPRPYSAPAPLNEDDAFSRTSYRPNGETPEQAEESIHEEAERAQMDANDLLKPDKETNLDAFDPRPIEVTEQAGISPDVSEIISRMEAEAAAPLRPPPQSRL